MQGMVVCLCLCVSSVLTNVNSMSKFVERPDTDTTWAKQVILSYSNLQKKRSTYMFMAKR